MLDVFMLSIIVLIYLLMVGYVGYVAWRRTKSSSDYMVAGRNTHPYIMALSYGATFISTAAIVGFGGVAANYGFRYFMACIFEYYYRNIYCIHLLWKTNQEDGTQFKCPHIS